jgi:hypothetical protein
MLRNVSHIRCVKIITVPPTMNDTQMMKIS